MLFQKAGVRRGRYGLIAQLKINILILFKIGTGAGRGGVRREEGKERGEDLAITYAQAFPSNLTLKLITER